MSKLVCPLLKFRYAGCEKGYGLVRKYATRRTARTELRCSQMLPGANVGTYRTICDILKRAPTNGARQNFEGDQ